MPAWLTRLVTYGRTLLRFLAAIQRAEKEVEDLRDENEAIKASLRRVEGKLGNLEARMRDRVLAGKDTNYDGDAPR